LHCQFHGELTILASKLVNEAADDWDLNAEAAAFAYRVNVQASTKKTPFEQM